MKYLGGNVHSSLFPQNLKFLFSSKLGGMGGNGFRFNEIFVKIPKIPLLITAFFSHSAVKIYNYHSCTILSVLCKVKLLPLVFLFLLSAAIFGYCSNHVCLSFSFSFQLFASLFFFFTFFFFFFFFFFLYELFASHSWEWYIYSVFVLLKTKTN